MYISIRPGTGWNVTSLVGGRSLKVVAPVHSVFSQIEFHALCLVGVLLQLTFLSDHGAGVLCVFGI